MTEDDSSSPDENVNTASSSTFFDQLRLLLAFVAIWQFVFTISNAAIANLLHFLKFFISATGVAFGCGKMQDMGDAFPVTVHSLHHILLEKNNFLTYVVACPKCDSVYSYSDCFEVRHNGEKESKGCSHIKYPNHPQRSQRKCCWATLLRKVKTKCGYSLLPMRSYPYKPLKQSIAQLVKREGFLECCEKWRERKIPQDYFGDV